MLIDETKFREKLAVILSKPRYTSLSTGRYEQLINDVVEAANQCEGVEVAEAEATIEETAVAEEEA